MIGPKRQIPDVTLSPCPPEAARLAIQGWDYLQESLNVKPRAVWCARLDRLKAQAVERKSDLSATVECEFNGEVFQCAATGAKGGTRWRLENDDYVLLIGSPKRDWAVSIRYLSAGIWEHGFEKIRNRAMAAMRNLIDIETPDDFIRVSRADWCFDFYAPNLKEELQRNTFAAIVTHSRVKQNEVSEALNLWGSGGFVETVTIGAMSGCQVQLYDKTIEIDKKSGKTWFYSLWREGLGFDPWGIAKPSGMWRLECRWSSEFLHERNIRRTPELVDALDELIAEAVVMRRLTIPNLSDTHRSRWPLHPIWSEAFRVRGATMMAPIGRQVTGRRDALREIAVKQIAGAMRSATVLDLGQFKNERMMSLAGDACALVMQDEKHAQKVATAVDRYSTVDEAK